MKRIGLPAVIATALTIGLASPVSALNGQKVGDMEHIVTSKYCPAAAAEGRNGEKISKDAIDFDDDIMKRLAMGSEKRAASIAIRCAAKAQGDRKAYLLLFAIDHLGGAKYFADPVEKHDISTRQESLGNQILSIPHVSSDARESAQAYMDDL